MRMDCSIWESYPCNPIYAWSLFGGIDPKHPDESRTVLFGVSYSGRLQSKE
jgi:hypothetical protein